MENTCIDQAGVNPGQIKSLLSYIDKLTGGKSGFTAIDSLNLYRRDELRTFLSDRLGKLVASFNPAISPVFGPFARNMLRRMAFGFAAKLHSKQSRHKEASAGYLSLDIPIDPSNGGSETFLDRVPSPGARIRAAIRLRRFYTVLDMMAPSESRLIHAMLDAGFVKAHAAKAVGMSVDRFKPRLGKAYRSFRRIWNRID